MKDPPAYIADGSSGWEKRWRSALGWDNTIVNCWVLMTFKGRKTWDGKIKEFNAETGEHTIHFPKEAAGSQDECHDLLCCADVVRWRFYHEDIDGLDFDTPCEEEEAPIYRS